MATPSTYITKTPATTMCKTTTPRTTATAATSNSSTTTATSGTTTEPLPRGRSRCIRPVTLSSTKRYGSAPIRDNDRGRDAMMRSAPL